MLDVPELERLLSETESEWVERKSSLSDKDKIRRTICAFANDLADRRRPALLLVGVDDEGNPSGLEINDRLLQEISFLRDDGRIQPLPHLEVRAEILKGSKVAIVTVWPSAALPVRCDGVVWVRVGPRLSRATPEVERRLTERDIAATLPFDHRPCPPSTLADLDVAAFRAEYLPRVVGETVLRENHRTIEYQLASLRLLDLRLGVPTHAGILAFGTDPQRFLPGAYLQFTRYDGTSRAARVLDHKTLAGRLREQLLQLDALLPIQIRSPRSPGPGLRQRDQPDYPLEALREFVLNAIMHRTYEGTGAPVTVYWYSDRVEIGSPGGLYGQVTPTNYTKVNDYRNPGVAEILKGLGYVERFGSGIVRAQAALLRNGNPPAAFTFEPTHVLVEIPQRHRAIAAAAKRTPHPPQSPVIPEPERLDEEQPGEDEDALQADQEEPS